MGEGEIGASNQVISKEFAPGIMKCMRATEFTTHYHGKKINRDRHSWIRLRMLLGKFWKDCVDDVNEFITSGLLEQLASTPCHINWGLQSSYGYVRSAKILIGGFNINKLWSLTIFKGENYAIWSTMLQMHHILCIYQMEKKLRYILLQQSNCLDRNYIILKCLFFQD